MTKLKKILKESISITLISFITLVSGFAYLEPNITSSATDTHTVKQTVTAEISFVATPAEVTMSPTLAGTTGGTADGATQFRIVSGNTAGFTLTLNTDTSTGMDGDDTIGVIPPLTPTVVNIPDYAFTSAPANTAEFGYSVNASTTGQISQLFRNNGSNTCNTGSTETDDNCWLNASSSAVTILSTSSATESSGATTSIKYRVIISANPVPIIPNDIYTATTTLTATNN